MSLVLKSILFFLFMNVIFSEHIAVTADYHYDIGEFKKAAEEYRKIKKDSYNYLNLIDCLYQTGEFNDAEIESNEFKLKFLNSSDYYFLLAMEEFRRGELVNSKKLFEKSLEKNRSNHRAKVESAICDLKLHDYRQMEEKIEELLKNRDNYSEILYIYGLFYRIQGRYEMSEKYFESSLLFSPNDVFVNAEIYRNKIMQRKSVKSVYYFRKNRSFYMRTVIDAIDNLINNEGDLNEIIKRLRKIRYYDQGVKTYLALSLFKAGKKNEARKIICRLLKKYSDVNIVRLGYGIINLKNDYAHSRSMLKKSLEPSLYLNDPVLFFRLAKSLSGKEGEDLIEEMRISSGKYINDYIPRYDYEKLLGIMLKK